MKRPRLLLVVALVLALVGVLVWKLLTRERADSTVPAPIEAPNQPSTMSTADTETNVDAPRIDATGVSVDSSHTRAVGIVEGATLRIHVKLDGLTRRPRNFHLSLIDAYACDVALEDDSEFEFSASALAAGTYMLELVSDGIQNTHQIVEVKSSPREQDVDLSARRKQRLRVRWSGINRSIQDELAAMPIREDRRVTLRVHATMQRPRQSGLPIEEWTAIASISRTFDLHPRANDTNMVDEAPQLSSRFPPNDPEVTADTFGYLLLPEPLPLYVSVWIDGHLIDTDVIAESAVGCTFTTSLEGLPDMRASLSLCLVDDETRAPIRSGTIRELGRFDRDEPWSLDGSNCLVDMRTQPNWNDLMITCADYAPMLLHVMTPPGTATKLGEVRLSKPRQVEVHIVDSAGAAVLGVDVRAYSIDYFYSSQHIFTFENVVSTGSDGNARLGSLGRGQYVVLANSADKMCAPRFVDTRLATIERLEMIAQPAFRIGIHVDPPPPPGATVCVRSKSTGLPVLVQGLSRGGWTSALLASDEYRVQLIDDGVASDGVNLTVGDTSFIFEIAR